MRWYKFLNTKQRSDSERSNPKIKVLYCHFERAVDNLARYKSSFLRIMILVSTLESRLEAEFEITRNCLSMPFTASHTSSTSRFS